MSTRLDHLEREVRAGIKLPPEREPVPVNWLTIPSDTTVVDVITNPRITPFLQTAREKGCPIVDGVEMLVQLAMQIFEEWTGITPDEAIAAIRALIEKERA